MKEYIVQACSQETIDSFDAHNAPELIRCKDCKHGQFEQWDNGECVDKTVYCDGYGIHKPDWFCADGVAKDINVPGKEGR